MLLGGAREEQVDEIVDGEDGVAEKLVEDGRKLVSISRKVAGTLVSTLVGIDSQSFGLEERLVGFGHVVSGEVRGRFVGRAD